MLDFRADAELVLHPARYPAEAESLAHEQPVGVMHHLRLADDVYPFFLHFYLGPARRPSGDGFTSLVKSWPAGPGCGTLRSLQPAAQGRCHQHQGAVGSQGGKDEGRGG